MTNIQTNKSKFNLLKRGLALLLVLAMLVTASATAFSAYAATTDIKYPIKQIEAPVEDGVYYADINLMNAVQDSYSMGNAALRGSQSFLAKNKDDTDYSAIVVVKDGKATAIVEFMPMGYVGQAGFMMELDAVETKGLTQYGGVAEQFSTYTPATVLAQHRTQQGEIVYDSFNDPNSEYKFDGSDPSKHTRPAGFGYSESRLVNIVDQPYSHVLALDVTPIQIEGSGFNVPNSAADFNMDNAAYVHVFVPVMFSISQSSGDQYAKMMVDWATLEKIEDPSTSLYYQLYSAMQIEKGNYTSESYNALQNEINDSVEALSNIWPSQQLTLTGTGFQKVPELNMISPDENTILKKLNAAVSSLELKGEKETLASVIEQAKEIDAKLYTDESFAVMKAALDVAEKTQSNDDAGVTAVSNAVQTLNEAINALVYKDADYSAVDAAIEKIPADLSAYTQSSVDAVNAAKDAVVRGKNITEQDSVDAMAKRITEAVSALELQKDDSSLNKNNLADGVYSINGEMIKVNRQDKSMSNDAINHTIKLTVENGKYYLTMDFHGLHYLNRFGYLAKLSYYDNGYTYGQYGVINGNLIPAEVLSTQKNADGTDVIDEFNQVGGSSEGLLYPEQLKFPLVADALNDDEGYVPLHVFVPVMEDISEGTGDQDVLLKLDWSTLKKTTDDDPNFIPDAPVELSPAIDYTDATTGVKVHADKGVFDEGVQIIVTEITLGADYDNAASALSEVGKKFKLYNVKFVGADGNEVTPNGTVTISLPATSGDDDNLAVYRINDDGSKTLVKGDWADGYYTIVTKTAGNYAIVEKGSTITDEQNTQNVNNTENDNNSNGSMTSPSTGAPENFASFIMLAFSAIGMLGVIGITKKRKSVKE